MYAPASLPPLQADTLSPLHSASRFAISNKWQYIVEWGTLGTSPRIPVELEDDGRTIAWYQLHLLPKPHHHYYGEGDETIGPVVISVEESDGPLLRAFVRRKAEDIRIVLPSKNTKKAIGEKIPDLSALKLEKVVFDPVINAALAAYESKLLQVKYKFGLLVCRPGQQDEDQWYQNRDLSPDLEVLLSILGDRISLKGWTRYTGGLDTKENLTGTHSVYTAFRDLEVMFHVSPLLPFSQEDTQQLERKRHLGNDVCLLIFREEGCTEPFNPASIHSQMNHVFCVVQPARAGGSLKFRVALVNKPGVPPYGPPVPVPGSFDAVNQKAELRDFLLAKLINGERSAMAAPDFKSRGMQTRKALLMRQIADIKKQDPKKK